MRALYKISNRVIDLDKLVAVGDPVDNGNRDYSFIPVAFNFNSNVQLFFDSYELAQQGYDKLIKDWEEYKEPSVTGVPKMENPPRRPN